MINVLVLHMDISGVGYYRLNAPFMTMDDPDINVDIIPVFKFNTLTNDEILKYNVIVYQKILPVKKEKLDDFYKLIRYNNIKLIYDIDDFWELPHTHYNYKVWKEKNEVEISLHQIKNADYITTTTPLFADVISNINPNVIVLENAVNHIEQQWISKKIPSEKTRFLWGGGISHTLDIRILSDSIGMMDKNFRAKNQLYMCGYDIRTLDGNRYIKDDMSKSPWYHMEHIFTNNGKYVAGQYGMWLSKNDNNGLMNYGYNELFKDEFYQRRFTRPILTFGEMYNEADVALAPLKSSMFNFTKSQIKVIEAGVHGCPIIASKFGSYELDIIDGKNGFLIDENDKMGWLNKMKYFSENPNAVKEMGMALHELVMEKYTLEKINKKRIEFLKSI